MQKIEYDFKNNIIYIPKINKEEKKSQVINKELLSAIDNVDEKLKKSSTSMNKLRGFIITTVNNEVQLAELNEGNQQVLNLSPVLANDEDEAIELVSKSGKIVVDIVCYEKLKMQLSLIEALRDKEKINLLELDLFTIKINNE